MRKFRGLKLFSGRKIILGFTLLLIVGLLMGCGSTDEVKLGIVQIVEHPSLDASREGFLDVLAENGYKEGEKLSVDYQNAQGDQPTLQTIANKFVADKVDLVLAIATPSAQTMASATEEIPIMFTAVTDPVAAGLVETMEKPNTNLTGTSDLPAGDPIKEQLKIFEEFGLNVQKVGVIFNTSEKNSEVQVERAREVAPELGLELVEAVATNSSEVLNAAQSLIGKVDAIYVPTDNTVVSALESVIQVAEAEKLPLVVGEGDSVARGGLATKGIDYYTLGRKTGEMALEVINGKEPAAMEVIRLQPEGLILNKGAAERMGVTITEEILEKAVKVYE